MLNDIQALRVAIIALAAIFAVTLYGNWQRGRELSAVCFDVLGYMNQQSVNDEMALRNSQLKGAIRVCEDRID